MILFLQHILIEGPETLGGYLRDQGLETQTVHLYAGERLPESLKGIRAVICLGGPMNVDEEQVYPWLIPEIRLIQNVVKEQVPFLGICLGSQLLAKACGATVVKSPAREVGFYDVELTHEGDGDALFKGVSSPLEVYQWHEDMWQLPSGGKLLATGSQCPHQAFKVGSQAYGLQFHIEITDQSIREWSESYLSQSPESVNLEKTMLRDYEERKETFNRTAFQVYDNFFRLFRA